MTNKRTPLHAAPAPSVRETSWPFRFLRLPEVCERTGLSRSQIYRLEARGEFPARVKLGESASAWIDTEVAHWQASRVAMSREAK